MHQNMPFPALPHSLCTRFQLFGKQCRHTPPTGIFQAARQQINPAGRTFIGICAMQCAAQAAQGFSGLPFLLRRQDGQHTPNLLPVQIFHHQIHKGIAILEDAARHRAGYFQPNRRRCATGLIFAQPTRLIAEGGFRRCIKLDNITARAKYGIGARRQLLHRRRRA